MPVTYHSPLWKKERTKQAFERRSWSQDGAASAREWWHVWQQQNVMQSKSCSILVWTRVNQIIQQLRLLFWCLKDGLYPSKKNTPLLFLCVVVLVASKARRPSASMHHQKGKHPLYQIFFCAVCDPKKRPKVELKSLKNKHYSTPNRKARCSNESWDSVFPPMATIPIASWVPPSTGRWALCDGWFYAAYLLLGVQIAWASS